jgi:hypothetical protein
MDNQSPPKPSKKLPQLTIDET